MLKLKLKKITSYGKEYNEITDVEKRKYWYLLTGRKTFSKSDIGNLRMLGVEVEIEFSENKI